MIVCPCERLFAMEFVITTAMIVKSLEVVEPNDAVIAPANWAFYIISYERRSRIRGGNDMEWLKDFATLSGAQKPLFGCFLLTSKTLLY